MSKLLMVLVIFGVTGGCSNKEIYNNLRVDQRGNCVNEPPAIYFECMERTNKTYEEYERERKEVSK